MRTLLIVAVAAVIVAAFLSTPTPAAAQQPQFFGQARPVPFRWYSYAWDPVYGVYAVQRVGLAYPGSGYNWGYMQAYSPTYGYTTGYYQAMNNIVYPGFQYYPTYYDPAYFQAGVNYPSPVKRTNDYATKSYIAPQYYLTTY